MTIASLKQSAKDAYAKFDFHQTVESVESFLAKHANNTIEFLDEHPGISMVLSPTTITRRVAQKHIDDILNK